MTDLGRYQRDPVGFITRFIPKTEKGQPWTLSAYKRRVLTSTFVWETLGLLFRILLWSEVKKAGKTYLAACLGCWWAFTHAHTEVIVVANDLDQSVGRVFATMTALLKHNPVLGASATIRATEIQLSNGTTIRAISSDYRGAAGSRHSLVIFDELWGFTLERAERLFEELTPPPTEPDAWVLIVTTAGFTGESVLLERLYSRGLAGERLDPELEVYRADDLVMFWSHVPREPWQTGEVGARYYAEQRRLLRSNTYLRLHENRWTSAESAFITAEQYDACLEPTWSALDPTKAHPLWVGVDASTKRDSTAVVAVLRDEVENLVVVAQHRVWTPSAHHPVDLEAVESYLLDLARQYDLRTVRCDPYQFHGSMQRLRQHGLPIEEYPQTEDRLTRIGQSLYDLVQERRLVVYPDDTLRAHVLAASAKETPHGFRIVKTVATKKIDACVALAMAAHAATTAPVWAEPRLITLGG